MNRFLAVIFGLLVASCAEVDNDEQQIVLASDAPFKITVSELAQTRGAMVTEPGDMGSIGVYCALTGSVAWSDTTTFRKLGNRRFEILENGDCKIDGAKVEWGYATLEDKYSIYAYSPHNAEASSIEPRIENGELKIDYSVPKNSRNQPDLMLSLPRKDIMPQLVGTVPLKFHHALATVSFGVKSSSDSRIESIEIAGVVSDGTAEWNETDSEIEWSWSEPKTKTFSVEIDADYVLDSENSAQLNTEQGYLMMIPQRLDAGADVVLTMKDSGETKSLKIPAGTEWVAGGRYHYVIEQAEDDECDFLFERDEISNCYIIHPTPGEPTYVQIPIDERINDFWENHAEAAVTKIEPESDGSELDAILLWHDMSNYEAFDYEIKRVEDGTMVVSLNFPPEDQEGNVVFAIVKYTGEFDCDGEQLYEVYWSWHLWFTDYDPDALADEFREHIVPKTDKEYYDEQYHGAVHRYTDGDAARCELFGFDSVWVSIYADKFIMDRYIGELEVMSDGMGAGTLYYQYGRKDPFPGTAGVYGSGGCFEDYSKGMQASSLDEGVSYPLCFFYSSTGPDNWCGGDDARNKDIIWYDKDITAANKATDKSIFDPSPLGWCVPVYDTWNSYPDRDVDTSCSMIIRYPVKGWRDGLEFGEITTWDISSYMWCSEKDTYINGNCQLIPSKSLYHKAKSSPTIHGYPVRAIEQ